MKKHIVVIEDDPELREFLQLCLEQVGYRVTALRQLESVEELIALQPDAFVIDENLPVINGHTICIILKSKPETKYIPVLLISADERLETVASLSEADGYLSKPFDSYTDLYDLLDKILLKSVSRV